jgi:hypothetical protein
MHIDGHGHVRKDGLPSAALTTSSTANVACHEEGTTLS